MCHILQRKHEGKNQWQSEVATTKTQKYLHIYCILIDVSHPLVSEALSLNFSGIPKQSSAERTVCRVTRTTSLLMCSTVLESRMNPTFFLLIEIRYAFQLKPKWSPVPLWRVHHRTEQCMGNHYSASLHPNPWEVVFVLFHPQLIVFSGKEW